MAVRMHNPDNGAGPIEVEEDQVEEFEEQGFVRMKEEAPKSSAKSNSTKD